jgi:hypothetical protein
MSKRKWILFVPLFVVAGVIWALGYGPYDIGAQFVGAVVVIAIGTAMVMAEKRGLW